MKAPPSCSRGFRPPAGALNDRNGRSGESPGGYGVHNQTVPVVGLSKAPRRPLTNYLAVLDRNQLFDEPSGEWPWKVCLIGSYSWHKSSTSSDTRIVVPGVPPVYTPPSNVSEIHLELGMGPCQNALNDYDLSHPLETLHHVVENCTPTFDWSTVSLITNRGHLSDLLRFLAGRSSRPFEFTIDNTGERPAVIERSWKFHGQNATYGWSFEEAVTSAPQGTSDLLRHHAVSHLRLGGLNIVVRAETDAQEADVNELGVSLSWEGWELCESDKPNLWWQSSGNFRPDATLVEFQLVLGSCDKLVIGERREDAIIDITDATPEAFYEERCQPEVRHRLMARLGRSIEMILEAVEGRRAVVVWNGKSDRLIIREER